MDKNKSESENSQNDEPKIFGVYIDEQNNKKFIRRDFLKTAALIGTSVAIGGCNFRSDEDEFQNQLDEALRKTLSSMDNENEDQEQTSEDDDQRTENTPTSTATKSPTKAPTKTSTPEPTPTEATDAIGKVDTAHSIFMGPDTDHPVASKTVVDEEITILGKTSDSVWYKIKDSEGTIGWVYTTFITVITEIKIPIIYNIPTPPPPACTCVAYVPCDCDSYTKPSCGCDSDTTTCTCDVVHYWYPN
jgi:hypothetical protein